MRLPEEIIEEFMHIPTMSDLTYEDLASEWKLDTKEPYSITHNAYVYMNDSGCWLSLSLETVKRIYSMIDKSTI